jgi:hypothetical protein
MQLGLPITRHNLMTLESYDEWRRQHKAALMGHRRLRSVRLGEHVLIQFESEQTVRYQIQEMLRIEKIFDANGIQHEIDAYAPLVPSGHNWMATLMIDYTDTNDRQQALQQLIGLEDHISVRIEGCEPSMAIADEDLDRESATKTSAVHFLRFELNDAQRLALQSGAGVSLQADHAHYSARVGLETALLASLREDIV